MIENPQLDISEQYKVRHTNLSDLDMVMDIYNLAKIRMHQSGNTTQWAGNYPSREIVETDIIDGNSYVIESGKKIYGVFSFIIGQDPTYAHIDGAWPDQETYGTIHRIASAPGTKGIADICLDFCKSKNVRIRIDTHVDNAPMLGWINKRGFTYCGVITVGDGTPRKAFQLNPLFE
ncbi:MAG: N-acetyltransferase [Lachnospiraceae bacterium]|nr:N-acetyltransferase [Lachnospiraceae bacterium]